MFSGQQCIVGSTMFKKAEVAVLMSLFAMTRLWVLL